MPIKPVDHTKSVVYRFVYNHITYYVGSTTNFTNRKSTHKCNCYNEKNEEKYNLPIYKFIRETGGWTDDWNMILVQSYPECKSSIELRMYEQEHLDLYRPDLNVNRAFVSKEDKREIINDNNRNFRLNNPEYNKEYQIVNRNLIHAKHKEKFTCQCGGKFTYCHKSEHNKSKKHQKYLESLPPIVQQP